MSDNKKYYWLKLKYDFFTSKEIKKLRKIAGGDTYTIIYLKMQLKSLKDDCKLYFEGVENDFCEELALDIDEEVENVRVTLAYLENRGLIELHSENGIDEYHLIEARENTGSETPSAVRVRKHRANKKALPSNTDVTSSNSEVINCNPELEIESEKEKSKIKKEKKENLSVPDYSFKDGSLCKSIEDSFILIEPFTDFAIERKAIKRIAGYIYKDAESHSREPCEYAHNFMESFYSIYNDQRHFLHTTPFKPSAVSYNVYQRIIEATKEKTQELTPDQEQALAWLMRKKKK